MIPRYNYKDGDSEDWMRFQCALELQDWEVYGDVNGLVNNLWLNLQEAVRIGFPRKVRKLKGNWIPKIV